MPKLGPVLHYLKILVPQFTEAKNVLHLKTELHRFAYMTSNNLTLLTVVRTVHPSLPFIISKRKFLNWIIILYRTNNFQTLIFQQNQEEVL